MKLLLMVVLLFHGSIFAQDKEGDLQLPVSDIQQERQEQELPPTLDEVEMKEKKEKPAENQKKKVEEKKSKRYY